MRNRKYSSNVTAERLDAKWKYEIPRRYLVEKLQRPDRFGNRDRYKDALRDAAKFYAIKVVTASFVQT